MWLRRCRHLFIVGAVWCVCAHSKCQTVVILYLCVLICVVYILLDSRQRGFLVGLWTAGWQQLFAAFLVHWVQCLLYGQLLIVHPIQDSLVGNIEPLGELVHADSLPVKYEHMLRGEGALSRSYGLLKSLPFRHSAPDCTRRDIYQALATQNS